MQIDASEAAQKGRDGQEQASALAQQLASLKEALKTVSQEREVGCGPHACIPVSVSDGSLTVLAGGQ